MHVALAGCLDRGHPVRAPNISRVPASDLVNISHRVPSATFLQPHSTDEGKLIPRSHRYDVEDIVASDLLCFSHLRWDVVWQRPQHLMSRAARSRRVWFIEEPAEIDREPCLEIRPVAENLKVMVPRLPPGMSRHSAVRTQLSLLRHWFEPRLSSAPLHWYYTPLARSFGASLPSSAIVYDCIEELSTFAGAPPSIPVWESELLAAADIVFTDSASVYEAKRSRHPNVHAFPSSADGLSWDATWSVMHERVEQAERCRPERWLAGGATRTANAAIAAARQR